MVTYSLIVVLSPISAVVDSPAYLRSCGIAPMTAPGNMRQFLPMREPLKTVTCGMMCVPASITTSPYTTENASMVTFDAIFAFGSTCAKGLIILLRSFYNLCYHLGFANQPVADKNSPFHFTYSPSYWIR